MLRAFPHQGRRPLFVFMRLSNFFNLGESGPILNYLTLKKKLFSDSFSTYASEKRKALCKNPLYGHSSSVSHHATDVYVKKKTSAQLPPFERKIKGWNAKDDG